MVDVSMQFFSVVCFLFVLVSVFLVEANKKPDALSIFVFIFSLQIVFPGIFLPVLLYFLPDNFILGITFFDKLYGDSFGFAAIVVAINSGVFVFCLYLGFGFKFLPSALNGVRVKREIVFVQWRLYLVVAIGCISMAYLFFLMPGEGLGGKYTSLILFRAQDPSVFDFANNFITANLFALTQTFSILAVCLFFYIKQNSERPTTFQLVAVGLVVVFVAFFAVSRRMMAIQLFVVYFAVVLMSGRWYLKRMILVLPFGVFWLGFGKELIWGIANWYSGVDYSYSGTDEDDIYSKIIYSVSSLGISLNSSWATFMYLDDMWPRFGLDHIFSALRLLPLGVLGIDEDVLYGTRIVRISTQAFVDGDALDIPPGLIGQMWLDFRLLGPVVWGLGFGMILRVLQSIFLSYQKTWSACGIFSIILFFVALPINSGSFDFNFSVDMVFLLFFIWLVTRVDKFKIIRNVSV